MLPAIGAACVLVCLASRRAWKVRMNIEVERKFEPPADLEELDRCVRGAGGERLGEESFTDVYYDTPEFALARRDVWLRCREGFWELKVRAVLLPPKEGGDGMYLWLRSIPRRYFSRRWILELSFESISR